MRHILQLYIPPLFRQPLAHQKGTSPSSKVFRSPTFSNLSTYEYIPHGFFPFTFSGILFNGCAERSSIRQGIRGNKAIPLFMGPSRNRLVEFKKKKSSSVAGADQKKRKVTPMKTAAIRFTRKEDL